jgi:Yeast mitochondrial distribution and morphology (MDM) proteins
MISIFNATIKTFRKQWLFYDLLSEADGVVGMYDGCLFSLHRPQMVDGPRDKMVCCFPVVWTPGNGHQRVAFGSME